MSKLKNIIDKQNKIIDMIRKNSMDKNKIKKLITIFHELEKKKKDMYFKMHQEMNKFNKK